MGAVNSVRKLTIDSIALLEQLEPNATELAAKHAVQRRVQQLLQQEWPTCRVLAFGSSESRLGFGGCDVDLGIYFEDVHVDAQGQFSPQERVTLLATACERLASAFQVQNFVRNARVPVIKLWDPERQVACDICVGGINVLLNTALLKYYGQVDLRVRPLVFAVKYWAKQRGINDSLNGTLSSYGYTLLLIFYLQSHYAEMQFPAILALFQNLQSQTKVSVLLQRLRSFPTMEIPSPFGTSEFNSVGALLAGFFDFFACRFNMEDEVVSVRTGRALSKTTKWSHPLSWRLSIEDPFELAHDVGRVIFHRKGQNLIRAEFKRANNLLIREHRLRDICEPDQSSWNNMSSCYICLCRDHITRDCGQLVIQRLKLGNPGSKARLLFSDCWYCGEYGHYKAECPMLFFRDIPCPLKVTDNILPAESATALSSIPLFKFAPPSTPTVPSAPESIPFSIYKERIWERGLIPLNSPMLRLSKKKKRARHGATSSLSSPPSFCHLPSNGLSQSEKRQQKCYQQQRQEQRHELHKRNFEMMVLKRKCGGNARSGRSHTGKVLCLS